MTARDKAAAWDRGFWLGKRVLVTGHTGFKGAWLVAWLQTLGAKVTGFSLPESARESLAWQCMRQPLQTRGLQDVRGDIRDAEALTTALAAAQPEVVFHLAAQAIVLDSYAQPEETWDVNVMGSLRLLQALAARQAPATFIGVTSDKCYDNKEWAWGYRENDPLGGKDPYSASKAACEIMLASWRHSFSAKTGVRVASARAGNVIGGGDNAPSRIVPDLLTAFAAGQPAVVRNPHSTRPYQHVLEPLSGYLLLARIVHSESKECEQAYNFGPGSDGDKQTGWLAECVAQCWGSGASLAVSPVPGAAHEAGTLMLDSSKARQDLGWRPAWTTEAAIQATVQWHKAFLTDPQQAYAETLGQLARYETASPDARG